MDNTCLVFLHLPKTAGSTLSTVIRWQYRHVPPDQVLRVTERGVDEIDRLSAEQRARLRVVMGHFPYGIHGHLPMPCRYITIARDPVRRVVSVYRYILSTRRHPLHAALASSSMSLEEYVTSGVHREQVENALTAQLAGREEGSGELTERDVEIAIDNLRRFFAVGLTERFDETLILLKRELAWTMPFYFSRNISEAGPRLEDVPSDVIGHIRERNGFDLRVWEVAREMFASAVQAQREDFAREVRRFNLINWAPKALGSFLEPIAPRVRRRLEQRASRHQYMNRGSP